MCAGYVDTFTAQFPQMLVKKVFDRSKRMRRRKWRLERFDGADDLDTESVTRFVITI